MSHLILPQSIKDNSDDPLIGKKILRTFLKVHNIQIYLYLILCVISPYTVAGSHLSAFELFKS